MKLFFTDNRHQVFLSLHSYGQYILIPWGYEVTYPTDYDEMLALANSFASKFVQFKYTVGNSAALLYPASGLYLPTLIFLT